MTDDAADGTPPDGSTTVDNVPTVSCSRCNSGWTLEYELDELLAGNSAVEQFALDHERHTGHFPDSVTPWIAECRQCPDGDAYLTANPTRRWAETHARHTGHEVTVTTPDGDAVRVTDETDWSGTL